MRRKKQYIIIGMLLLVCSCFRTLQAQDIHFSQFFETPLLRNPSLAGIFTGDYRLQMVYRDQWRSVTDGYKTASLNGEYKLPIGKMDDFITVGGQVLFDRAGSASLTQTSLLPVINYHKSVSQEKNNYLSLGFMGGVVNRNFDQSKMITESGGAGSEPNVTPNYTYLDGSVGMSFNSQLSDNQEDNFYIGLAYHHFTKPKNTFFRDPAIQLNPKWVASTGFRFAMNEFSFVTVQADHSIQQEYKETILGGLYGMKLGGLADDPLCTLNGGVFLRLNDAFIPVVKLDYSGFSFAFSYDINISKLKPASLGRGGFELSLSYIGFTQRNNSALNAVKCPRF